MSVHQLINELHRSLKEQGFKGVYKADSDNLKKAFAETGKVGFDKVAQEIRLDRIEKLAKEVMKDKAEEDKPEEKPEDDDDEEMSMAELTRLVIRLRKRSDKQNERIIALEKEVAELKAGDKRKHHHGQCEYVYTKGKEANQRCKSGIFDEGKAYCKEHYGYVSSAEEQGHKDGIPPQKVKPRILEKDTPRCRRIYTSGKSKDTRCNRAEHHECYGFCTLHYRKPYSDVRKILEAEGKPVYNY